MVKILFTCLLFIFSSPTTSENQHISPQVFKTNTDKYPAIIIVDVRTPSEFNEGHIDRAINIDYKNDGFDSEIEKLDKAKKYYIYCRSGYRSSGALEVFEEKGFERVFDLDGGFLAWKEAGYPTVK